MCLGVPSHETTWPNEFTLAPLNNPPEQFTLPPSNDLHEWVYMADIKWPIWTSLHGHPQMTKMKGQGRGGKWVARTCTWPTSGHNLAFLIRAHVPQCDLTLNDPTEEVYNSALKWSTWTCLHSLPQMIHPNEFTQWSPNDSPEQVYIDALKRPTWMRLHRRAQMTCLNEFTCAPIHDWNEAIRERGEKKLHECAHDPPGVTTLHFLYGLMCPGVPSHRTT